MQLYIACPQNANRIKSFFKSLQTSFYFWVKYATACMIASDCNLQLHCSAACVCKLLSVHKWTIHISFQIILSLARECPRVRRWWHWVSGWLLWFLYLLPQAGLQPAFLPLPRISRKVYFSPRNLSYMLPNHPCFMWLVPAAASLADHPQLPLWLCCCFRCLVNFHLEVFLVENLS